MERKDIKDLANNLMFDVSEEEIDDIAEEFKKLDGMLNFFEQINTDGVEEMVYPFDVETDYFREDEESNVLSQNDSLVNAGKVISGHVVVPKVLK